MSSLETELARLQAELDASRRELEVARAEVIRLRNLLGLDRPVPEGPRDGRLFAPEPLPSRSSPSTAARSAMRSPRRTPPPPNCLPDCMSIPPSSGSTRRLRTSKTCSEPLPTTRAATA